MPPSWKLTTPELMEHMLVDEESITMDGVSPDVDVASGVYVSPLTTAAPGAVVMKLIVWVSGPTTKSWLPVAAA